MKENNNSKEYTNGQDLIDEMEKSMEFILHSEVHDDWVEVIGMTDHGFFGKWIKNYGPGVNSGKWKIRSVDKKYFDKLLKDIKDRPSFYNDVLNFKPIGFKKSGAKAEGKTNSTTSLTHPFHPGPRYYEPYGG